MQLTKSQRIVSLFLFLLLLSLSFFLYWNYFSIQDVVTYQMDAYIAEPGNAGFNLDPDKLHFGLVAISSPYSYREIIFTNPYNQTARIDVHTEGNMSGYISYIYQGVAYADPYSFTLEAEQSTPLRIVFSFNKSEVVVNQYFTGELKIISRKTLFS